MIANLPRRTFEVDYGSVFLDVQLHCTAARGYTLQVYYGELLVAVYEPIPTNEVTGLRFMVDGDFTQTLGLHRCDLVYSNTIVACFNVYVRRPTNPIIIVDSVAGSDCCEAPPPTCEQPTPMPPDGTVNLFGDSCSCQ